MNYRQAFHLIKTDYARYTENLQHQNQLKTLLQISLLSRGVKYSFWLRLARVNGFLLPLCWIMHRWLSTRYCIQISRLMHIGEGLSLGHGVNIMINRTAYIGNHVTIAHFVSIGSIKGKAATIEDNVYIGPNVSILEDVIICHHAKIGAGSVVTHDIPPFSIAVGVPAKGDKLVK